MFLMFHLFLKNQPNLKNHLNLTYLKYHLFLMFEIILMNLLNLKNHLNLMFLTYH